ncbi:MAG: peptidylprolyl isomerase [Chitinispirillales bacterium]|jgi:parvulin-like peptidyl-prolyl isomerase|nr:peptidylprolyl isomerase [Chitinispirillales bacterium]
MINKMREMAPIMMVVILVVFVGGTIFLDWGMNATGQGRVTNAGKINGKEISLERFDRLVSMERMRMQEQTADIPQSQYRMIPTMVWNQEVSRVLIEDVVKSMKLGSTDEEVFEYLKRNPIPGLDTASIFITDGRFDTTKYVQWLSTPQTYTMYPWMVDMERQVRDLVLPGQKLEALLKAGVFASPAEAAFDYAMRNDKATFEFVKIENRNFRSDSAEVSDKMIRDYYSANQSRFIQDEQSDLYFVRFPKAATPSDEQANLEELQNLKKRIESGEFTFEIAAQNESDDEGSALNGGSLGWFGKGAMVPEFEAVAFALEVGVISDPVKSSFGFHLIKVEERSEENGEIKVNARHILLKNLPSDETLDKLSDDAENLRIVMVQKGFAEAVNSDPSVTLDSTGLFKRGAQPQKLGIVSGAGGFAFSRKQGEISDVLDSENALYILSVKEKVKKGAAPLERVRPQIVETLKDTLAMREAKKYAAVVLEKVKSGLSIGEIAESDKALVTGTATDAAVMGYLPDLGYASKTASAALSLPAGKISDIIEERGGFSIVRVLSKSETKEFDPSTPEAKQLAAMSRNQGRQSAYGEWYRNLQSGAKIESNVDKFYLD